MGSHYLSAELVYWRVVADNARKGISRSFNTLEYRLVSTEEAYLAQHSLRHRTSGAPSENVFGAPFPDI